MQGSSNNSRNSNLTDQAGEPGSIFNQSDSLRWRSSSSRRSRSLSRVASDLVLGSIRLSHELADHILADVDSSALAQIGDSGDRVVEEEEEIDSNVMISTVTDEAFVMLEGLRPTDAVSPLAEEPIFSTSKEDHAQLVKTASTKDKQYKLPHTLDYCAYLIHLSVFGFLGVFTRYLLQKLFGPGHLALTSDQTPLYLDLPSNILGSFLMGWFGIVFKPDLRHVSEHLAVGITTGYMGSLTTFSGWNQKMHLLSSKGHWMFAVAGMLLGMLIVNESITIGVESAEGLRKRFNCKLINWKVDTKGRHVAVTATMLFSMVTIWVVSCVLAVVKVHHLTNGAVLWLGCVVAPPGVWTRWYLARLNGVGIGKKSHLKWFPIGTFLANVIAACIMAALSVISKAVNTERSGVILSGIQLGFLGCMSTVSTFVAEVYTMRQSGHSGRAFIYAASTVMGSFLLGTCIYSVPVWTKNYY
ncbi:camphor resistance CrcB family protein [Rhynchospora pubera]|uniref:Camphor resistance CrcB family protein n=1 Tax=Rhynchospora pubera TaxID=906938 RepID=A0AAV8HUJ1_9POAL|nr:camphor resistance CrcB family protein [Rhynchospora pubera]